jgi:hypothetical protein
MIIHIIIHVDNESLVTSDFHCGKYVSGGLHSIARIARFSRGLRGTRI